jgi:single-strand DNA-binding protein
LNKVIICGRLTRDPEVRTGQTTTAKYTLAVDRRFKKDGADSADFISCVAFGKSAEFAEKYLHKGTKILVIGRIQTGNYTNKDGNKVYTTDVVVEEHEFVESKNSSAGQASPSPAQASAPEKTDDFMNIPAGIEDELPFV